MLYISLVTQFFSSNVSISTKFLYKPLCITDKKSFNSIFCFEMLLHYAQMWVIFKCIPLCSYESNGCGFCRVLLMLSYFLTHFVIVFTFLVNWLVGIFRHCNQKLQHQNAFSTAFDKHFRVPPSGAHLEINSGIKVLFYLPS